MSVNAYLYEHECWDCGRENLEDGGYVVVRRSTYDMVLVCKECYDSAPDDEWGLIYLEWG